MTDASGWQPVVNELRHSIRVEATVLTTTGQSSIPEPAYSEPKQQERRSVHGDPIVAGMPIHDGPQPLLTSGMGACMAA